MNGWKAVLRRNKWGYRLQEHIVTYNVCSVVKVFLIPLGLRCHSVALKQFLRYVPTWRDWLVWLIATILALTLGVGLMDVPGWTTCGR